MKLTAVWKESLVDYLENPFTPSFGEVPAHLAGRQQIIRDLGRAFCSRRRRPELTSIFSGARGTGKTALMSSLATQAESLGWIAVKTTALPGMLEEIELGAKRAAAHLINLPGDFEITGVGIAPLGSIEVNRVYEASTWRYRMSDIIDQLNEAGAGLLITVDVVDPTLDEMIQLAATYQHFVTDGKRVALLMAGLPNNVSTLLNHKTVSFLRRAQQYHLGRIADHDVREALIRTIQENDRLADAEGIDKAVHSIAGFPFLLQLVGYRAWDLTSNSKEISSRDFDQGIKIARDEMDDRILAATYRELTAEDKRFLIAMLDDEEESTTADLVERLKRSPQQVSRYRRRMIDAGIIGERGRGIVAFELPFFRDYLAAQCVK